ncbi:MAG: Uma2 family endonuclease [Clostridium sp.]|nr:Uma2 family endonuclease [Clostridium sp.]
MTLNEMRRLRIEMGISYKEMAEKAGIPLGTLQKVFGGVTQNPRRETLRKIEEALLRERRISPAGTSMVREKQTPYYVGSAAKASDDADKLPHVYPRQGQYTVQDYLSLPDDQRVELIDGVFYDMAAPSYPHQIIGGSLHAQLLAFRNSRRGPCIPLISPADVQLDRDEKTMVQPDVMIVCDRSKIERNRVFGAPDFIAEVLSPSTRKKDMNLKMMKYAEAGVREYWLIDPDTRQVVVYDLEHESIPVIYTFGDPIPVLVWNGECVINLTDAAELLDELNLPAD